MKKAILTTILLIIFQYSKAQYSSYSLEYNNASARINNSGVLFNAQNTQESGYKVPKSESQSLIYSSAFWFAGKDANDNLGLAAVLYGTNGNDFQAGPYSTNSSYGGNQYTSKYGTSIWTVNLTQVNNHIQNWNSPGYVMSPAIANWPGNGDTTLGVAYHLAPFVDLNFNGKYEPEMGEYPSLKDCEQSVYMILNDDREHSASKGGRLGIEIHYIFYQYTTSDFLNNTTLVDVIVYNRSVKDWNDFKIGMYLDPNLGYPSDDYVGSNPEKNLFFAYNGDNNDETSGSSVGYGTNPPAFGVVSLNKDLSAFISYASYGVLGFPTTPVSSWYNMNGLNSDGSQVEDMNGNPTTYTFSGDPTISNSYSEYQLGNMPGSRRVFSAYDMDNFAPGSSKKLSLAIIYNRSGNHLQNVTGLFSVADSIQTMYDNGTIGCDTEFPENLSISTIEMNQFVMFPNPANGTTTIQLQESQEGTIRVYSLDGAEVLAMPIQGKETTINTELLSGGIYLVDVVTKINNYKKIKLLVAR